MADGAFRWVTVDAADVPTPPSGRIWMFFDSSNLDHLSIKDESNVVTDLQNSLNFTDEKAQDAVGNILVDSADINFTYNDGVPSITAVLTASGVTPGTYGSPGSVSQVSIDAGGRVTLASTIPIVITPAQAGISANEIVDHSAVSVETSLNSGLSGGGDLTSSRSLGLDVNNLVDFGDPEDLGNGLFVPVYDSNDTNHKKIPRRFLASINPDLYYAQADDFIGAVAGGLLASATGTGSSNQAGTYGVDGAENALGVSQLDTGTTATGRASLGSSAATQLFKATSTAFRFRVRQAIELLSTPSDTFFQRNGLSNGFAAAGIGTEFLGFTYTDAQNGGRYEFLSRSGGVNLQVVDTGILADLDYHVFEIRWHKDGSADGYIDGTLVGTILSANAPVGVGLSIGWSIEKTVGITQRNLSSDWYSFEIYRDTVR